MRPIPFVALNRFEYINSIPYQANTSRTLETEGGNLPRDRHIWGLLLRVRGRLTMPASGGPSALLADAPYSLLDMITVEGYHKMRGQNEKIFELRGPDVHILQDLYMGTYFVYEPSSWSFSGSATNDFDFTLLVPFVPLGTSPLEQANYLLDAPNYDPLKLTVKWADVNSIVGSYTNAPSLSAYGSSSGDPVCEVSGLFALAGARKFAGQTMGRIWRFFQEVTDSRITSSANRVRLLDLPKGHFIKAVVLKSGTRATTVTAGNTAYSTLADRLSNIEICRGLNNAVRRFPRQSDLRNEHALTKHLALPAGIGPIDFARNGLLAESFNAKDLVAGPSGSVDFYLQADVSGASNAGLVAIIEEVRVRPFQVARV